MRHAPRLPRPGWESLGAKTGTVRKAAVAPASPNNLGAQRLDKRELVTAY